MGALLTRQRTAIDGQFDWGGTLLKRYLVARYCNYTLYQEDPMASSVRSETYDSFLYSTSDVFL